MKNILFVIGSTRANSFNRQLANKVEEMLEKKANVTYLDFKELPFFNQDTEFPTPDAVERVRNMVESSDGIWFFCPEYNRSYPGYLKNLIDWLSRTKVLNDLSSGTSIKGKKVTICGASGESAAKYAREKLKDLLDYIEADVYSNDGTGIALSKDEFISDKIALGPGDIVKLKVHMEGFLFYIDS